ncbi:MAG: FAD-dependent oxidoreductase, partial [Treponema sp.]|nr:FAD-dependent oxidoreductase [Treponema sp.]
VRRTRTIRCEYDITLDDIIEERGFADDIGRYGYQDIPNPKFHPAHGGSYGIPYRAIVPQKPDQLLVAGRMVTSDWRAHMSTRNTACCMLQGEAAGTAAALSVKRSIAPRYLDVKLLQKTLVENGVYLETKQ